MNLISLFDFEIKLEKFSIESFPLLDEISETIIYHNAVFFFNAIAESMILYPYKFKDQDWGAVFVQK